MSDLESIKSEPKAKRIIHSVSFDFSGAEVSYTDASQGGAASGMDDPILLKAKQPAKEDLTAEQVALLEAVGEEFNPLVKQKINTQARSSSSEDVDGEETKMTKGKEKPMSDDKTLERIAQLEKALAVSEAVNGLSKYEFESEVIKTVSNAIADLSDEGKEAITKAFDILVARGAEALEKAAENAKEEEQEGKTELQKSLETEAGHGDEAEGEVVEKSLADRVATEIEKAQKGDK